MATAAIEPGEEQGVDTPRLTCIASWAAPSEDQRQGTAPSPAGLKNETTSFTSAQWSPDGTCLLASTINAVASRANTLQTFV
ncbi:hypothetical protein LTS18_002225, partial [Coniosporium uncinatum]